MEEGANKPCCCKGIRTCLVCEEFKSTEVKQFTEQGKIIYVYCTLCSKAHKTGIGNTPDLPTLKKMNEEILNHCSESSDTLPFPGIELVENFLTSEEEKHLCSEIEQTPWVPSQSGRRKQDYGPKVNFKKKKLKTSVFSGLPPYAQPLVGRLQGMSSLKDFIPVELCNLEYMPARGAAIDSHFDDFWLWGERLVTINMVSDTAYTMTKDDLPCTEVLVYFPRLALIIMRDAARFQWKHGIQRGHITDLRIASTMRELTPEFLSGGEREALGKELCDIALSFKGHEVTDALKNVCARQ